MQKYIITILFSLVTSATAFATSEESSPNHTAEALSTTSTPMPKIKKQRHSKKNPTDSTQQSNQPKPVFTTEDLLPKIKNTTEKRFVFIVPGYNNANWIERTLVSIFTQRYSNYHIICIDDASTDNAVTRINSCTAAYNMHSKVTLIANKERQGMMANRYNAIYQCNDEDICIMLDGDDWLFPDPEILPFYNTIYSDDAIWTTYGQFAEYPSGKLGFSREYNYTIVRNNSFREHSFTAMHLRTFYAWLFKLIKPESFMHKNTFIKVATDWAIMYPILELAGVHSAFISKVTCVYNMGNPLSGFKKKNNVDAFECMDWIKSQPPYEPLQTKPTLPLAINNYIDIDARGYIGVNG